MGEMSPIKPALTFNGPLEAGVRAVAVLLAAFPLALDLQRLTAFDYLIVRTGQLGGPENIHPEGPIRTPATEVRRKLIEQSLLLMMTRDLVARQVSADGIKYTAGESAATFMGSMETPYLLALNERAEWMVGHFASRSDADFDAIMRSFFDSWVIEFQDSESQTVGAQ
jgi:hypothetical protein